MNLPSFVLGEDTATQQQINFHLYLDKKTGFLAHLLHEHVLPHEVRRRSRKTKDLLKLNFVISLLAANLLASNKKSPTVFYPRSKRHYSKSRFSYYLPSEVGFTILINAINSLEKAGMLYSAFGSNDPHKKSRERSSFTASPKFYECAKRFNISETDVRLNAAAAPVIKLKDQDKNLLPIDLHNERTAKVDWQVRSINEHLNQYFIELSFPTSSKSNKDVADAYSLGTTHLMRIFNNSSMQEGGRFYHGRWQNVKSDLRQYLTINSKPTVELDFSGFNLRAIYHHAGVDYRDDPYNVPSAAAFLQALGAGDAVEIRDIIKHQTNCMIGAHHFYKIPNPERKGVFKDRPASHAEVSKLRAAIKRHHSSIGSCFTSGLGLKFQFIESEICNDVLMRSVEANIPVLPIHDSFITTTENKDWLEETMVSAYMNKLTFRPEIH